MARCADRLEPLYDLLCKQVQSADVLFTDDTPVTIAQPRGGGGSKLGRVWIYLDREGRHAYDFTESRSQEGPLEWLSGFKGYLHADAYPGYDKAFVPDEAIEVACWAHARRKFIEAEKPSRTSRRRSSRGSGILYAVERAAKDVEMTDERTRPATAWPPSSRNSAPCLTISPVRQPPSSVQALLGSLAVRPVPEGWWCQ